jgi:outer membrane murein-binding lipoprotein Lpp
MDASGTQTPSAAVSLQELLAKFADLCKDMKELRAQVADLRQNAENTREVMAMEDI